MSISGMMLERSRKAVASSQAPLEREWAMSQPVRWQHACLAFAIASNTRGGVAGKSESQIVKEANAAGLSMTLRTFKRRVAVLQAYGVVYMDEFRPERISDGKFNQRASTWLFSLDKRMPDNVPLTSSERWHRMTPTEWMKDPAIDGVRIESTRFALPWLDSSSGALPF